MKPISKLRELQNEMPGAIIKYLPTRNCRYCEGTGKAPLKPHIIYKQEHVERGFKPCVCLLEPNIGQTVEKYKKQRIANNKRAVALLKERLRK